MGKILTEIRKERVLSHLTPRSGLCDIGIGGGAFVEAMECIGFDVNELAMEWLGSERRWNREPIAGMTFWDSLEHIPDPRELLAKCEKWAFISMPVYNDADHCLRSRHFKMPEHLWFFTQWGLCRYMAEQGFALLKSDAREQTVGRTDIGTYVFQRICTA